MLNLVASHFEGLVKVCFPVEMGIYHEVIERNKTMGLKF